LQDSHTAHWLPATPLTANASGPPIIRQQKSVRSCEIHTNADTPLRHAHPRNLSRTEFSFSKRQCALMVSRESLGIAETSCVRPGWAGDMIWRTSGAVNWRSRCGRVCSQFLRRHTRRVARAATRQARANKPDHYRQWIDLFPHVQPQPVEKMTQQPSGCASASASEL